MTTSGRPHLIYPSAPLRTRTPDSVYAEEFGAITDAGFNASVFSFESFESGRFEAIPGLPATQVIYRGWMLSPKAYACLGDAVRAYGAKLFTSPNKYEATHYLPNWYPLLTDFTPQTRIYPPDADLVRELRLLGWDSYFVKDFVKSLKTSGGAIIRTAEAAAQLAEEMKKFRGVVEGGYCVRRVEDLISETETRYFVLNGKCFAPLGSVPEIVEECSRRIHSPFFSIDVIERRDGVKRIVEIGDGQVSDLVGWTAKRFAEALSSTFS